MTNFVIGRDNMAVTVFVPWDCTNNCAFCTSKKDYSSLSGNASQQARSMKKIIDAIHEFNATDIGEFVFTGGEPLANLQKLKKLISEVDAGKKVYINTTFPCRGHTEARKIAEYINAEDKIKGISISRHARFFESDTKMFSENILKDRWLHMIHKPVRINCVINAFTNFEAVIMRYKDAPDNVSINFRADYRKISNYSLLKGFEESGFVHLSQVASLRYIRGGGCDVCNTNVFEYTYPSGEKRTVLYHRGFIYSAISFNDTTIVNDIIIKNDGEWYYDWDNSCADKEKLMEQLQKEHKEARKEKKESKKTPKTAKEPPKAASKSVTRTIPVASCGFGTYGC